MFEVDMYGFPVIVKMNDFIHYNGGILYWSKRTSNRVKVNDVIGAMTARGYLLFMLNKKFHYNHRFIWEHFKGTIPEGMEIDHRDGNRTNNRIDNLRLATQSENMFNAKLRADNTSGMKGLYWHKQNKYWYGRITANGVVHQTISEDKTEVELWLTMNRPLLHGEFLNNGTHTKDEL